MRIAAMLLIIGLLTYACTKEEDNPSMTTIEVRMTDNPLAIEEVNIDLQAVYVFTESGKDSFMLGTNTGIYNLLDYQNGLDTLIATATLSADSLQEVRLVLGDDNTVKVDGTIHDLKTPSAQQSGLKVKIHQALADIDVFTLLLDFDAEESVNQQGNGQYQLKPVLKVID